MRVHHRSVMELPSLKTPSTPGNRMLEQQTSAELETTFGASAAGKPATIDPARLPPNTTTACPHWTYRTACTAVVVCTSVVVYSRQATILPISGSI